MEWLGLLLFAAVGHVPATDPPVPPALRYSCVAASASLVSRYFGNVEDGRKGIPPDFKVKDDGAASVGALVPFLVSRGLNCDARTHVAPWYVAEYLSKHNCCVVHVTTGTNGRLRHALVLFPGRTGDFVASDLLGEPQVVDMGYLTETIGRDSILLVVSDGDIPSPALLHAKRYAAAYVIGLAAATLIVLWSGRGIRSLRGG